MTQLSEKCYITSNKYTTNKLLEKIIKSRVRECNDNHITEHPSTLVLTFESDKIDLNNTTFKLISEVCLSFKTVVIFNAKPKLFIALLYKLDSGISNIEMIKATTHSDNLRKSRLFCFAAENLFDVSVSIDFCSENVESFLNNKKRPYTIHFPPHHKLSLKQNELSDNYNYVSNYESHQLLSNPRFVNLSYDHPRYNDNSEESKNETGNTRKRSYRNYTRENKSQNQLGLGI